MRERIRVVVVLAAAAYAVVAMGEPPDDETTKPQPAATVSEKITVTETTEDLIYSVNRTPELTFETSRAVTVITGEEIRRTNPGGLAEVLDEQVGLVVSSRATGGTPIMRGLSGKQVMILIDGVKVNNAIWGGGEREYLNMIALDQIDRIEVVRGVVSVLGTESLGGVINVITKKGGTEGQTIGGSIGARWSSGDSALRTPLQFHTNTGRVRMTAGISGMRIGDINGGGEVGRQDTSFDQNDGYVNGHILLSHDSLIGFGYQNVQQSDVQWPGTDGTVTTARQFQLANLSYQDLTSRSFEDSLRVLVYWNNQEQGSKFRFGGAETKIFDGDVMGGANIELGKFIGSHHVVYGVDYSRDRVESWTFGPDLQGNVSMQRGTEMNSSKYSMLGLYLQDRFDPWKWLTMVAGARYGRFTTSGEEVTIIGPLSLDNRQSDFTGALNLIAHVSPNVNVIANVFRGFRAPNLDDTSRFAFVFTPSFGVQIPNAEAEAEHVMSYEGGVKFDRKGLTGSVFVFRNELTNLMAVGLIGFYDFDQNGKKDGFDFDILTNGNLGEAVIRGYEVEARYAARNGVSAWAHYAASDATDSLTGEPLAFVPGGAGAAGVRYLRESKRRPWAEMVWRHQSAQSNVTPLGQLDPGYAEGFDVLNVRGGFDITSAISATVGVDNVLDEQYRDIDQLTIMFGTGRQVVLGLAYHF